MTATVSGHPLPVDDSQPPLCSRPGHRPRRPASRFLVVAKGGVPRSPVTSSRRHTRAKASDGVDPRGAVATVPTAQAEREVGHAHMGMGAWVGQHLGGVHACLTTAGVARSDKHPLAVLGREILNRMTALGQPVLSRIGT